MRGRFVKYSWSGGYKNKKNEGSSRHKSAFGEKAMHSETGLQWF